MSEPKKPRKRIVARPQRRRIEDPVRQTVHLERRTAGILALYAKTRGVSESQVCEDALSQYFAGWKICDPEKSGEGEAAA